MNKDINISKDKEPIVSQLTGFHKLHGMRWLQSPPKPKKSQIQSKTTTTMQVLPKMKEQHADYIVGKNKKKRKPKGKPKEENQENGFTSENPVTNLPIQTEEKKSEVSENPTPNIWNSNVPQVLFPNAQGLQINRPAEEEAMNQAIVDSICTAQIESKERELQEKEQKKFIVKDDSDEDNWNTIPKNVPPENSNHTDNQNNMKYVDKCGRVNGYTERHMFMGKGARRREQEFLNTQRSTEDNRFKNNTNNNFPRHNSRMEWPRSKKLGAPKADAVQYFQEKRQQKMDVKQFQQDNEEAQKAFKDLSLNENLPRLNISDLERPVVAEQFTPKDSSTFLVEPTKVPMKSPRYLDSPLNEFQLKNEPINPVGRNMDFPKTNMPDMQFVPMSQVSPSFYVNQMFPNSQFQNPNPHFALPVFPKAQCTCVGHQCNLGATIPVQNTQNYSPIIPPFTQPQNVMYPIDPRYGSQMRNYQPIDQTFGYNFQENSQDYYQNPTPQNFYFDPPKMGMPQVFTDYSEPIDELLKHPTMGKGKTDSSSAEEEESRSMGFKPMSKYPNDFTRSMDFNRNYFPEIPYAFSKVMPFEENRRALSRGRGVVRKNR